jgi:hypothetical protein
VVAVVDADVVAGERREFCEQVGEAVGGVAVGGVVALKDPENFGGSDARLRPGRRRCSSDGKTTEVLG